MTDYTKTTDFTSKDSLPSGDSGKIIRGAEFGTEFDNIQTAVNSKSNTDNPTFTGTITGNGSGLTNVAAASIDLTVSSDTDADYNVPFMNATGDGGSAKVLQVDDNGLMFNPNSNTLSVNRLKGSNDNLLIQDTSGNTILDIDAGALEIPVNTTITGTTAVTGNITVTGTVDGRDVAADGIKLDTVETNADVTDTDNVTAAGALMDSELTDITAVKALNQGVATTDSPTFAGVTANGTVEFNGLSGTGAITVTDILDQDDMSGNSATALATQQSIKAYVDSQVGTVDTLAEVLANGNATGGTGIAFGANDKAIFGAGDDLQIYHDGSHSRIADRGTGDLRLYGDSLQLNSWTSANNYLTAATDGAVTIYYSGSEKLATTATGIDVTGTATMDGLTVDGLAKISAQTNGAYALRVGDAAGSSGSVVGIGKIGINPQNAGAFTYTGTEIRATETASGDYRASLSFHTRASAGDVEPLKRLDIANNGDVQFFENTGATPKFHWDAADERLGIGTSSPSETLTVSGNIQIEDNDGYLQFKDTNGGTNNKFRRIYNSAQDLFISRRNDDGSLEANDLVINSSGNVGIGTSSPVSELDVAGTTPTLTIKDTQDKNWTSADTTLGELAFRTSDTSGIGAHNVGFVRAVNEVVSGSTPSGALSFGVAASNANASEAMRIDSDGLVGIGTDNPSDTLSVVNLGSSGTGVQISSGTAAGDLRFKARTESYNGILSVYDSGSNEDVRISAHSGVSTYFNSGSNVGIGTDNPSGKLHVSGDGDSASKLTVQRTGATTGTTVLGYNYVGSFSNNDFSFYSNSAEAMRLDSSGNLAINRSSAAAKLDVNLGTSGDIAIFRGDDSDTFTIDSDGSGINLDTRNTTTGLTFQMQGANKMRLDASGNLLVGTTTSRGTKATIEGTSALVTAQGVLDINSTNALGANLGATVSFGGVSTSGGAKSRYAVIGGRKENATDGNYAGYFQIATTNVSGTTSEAMRIDSSGNLRIGQSSTTTPGIGNTTLGTAILASGLAAFSRAGGATNATLYVNKNTDDGPLVRFSKDGNSVGSIGTEGGALYISSPYGNDSGLRFVSGIVGPATTTGTNRDGAIDLGYDNGRFKDLYLSGGAYLGGTAAANKLDDYEEGTWTPEVVGSSTAGSYSNIARSGTYTKVGNVVTVWMLFYGDSGTGTGSLNITGLPFAAVANRSGISVLQYNSGLDIPTGHNTPCVMTNANATSAQVRCNSDSTGSYAAMGYPTTAGYLRFTLTYETTA